MASFRDHLVSAAESLMAGDLAETVFYNGVEIRAIVRRGRSAQDGTGFSSEGSSTEGTIRVKLSDVTPEEGDMVEISGEGWSVVREISRSVATVLLEVRTDRSVF